MSTQMAGPSLDIHGGGRDLIFPHHENERAQSEGTYEKPFVKYWLHNGFVNLNADKMSKSTGNFLTIRDVLAKYPHEAIRYFLLSAHYRSPLDFSEKNMEEALVALDRIYQTRERLQSYVPEKEKGGGAAGDFQAIARMLSGFKDKVAEAMDDDFNTAMSLGATFDLAREINKFLDAAPDAEAHAQVLLGARACFAEVGEILGVFGGDPRAYLEERKNFAIRQAVLTEEEILRKIAERRAARVAKDFKAADGIRNDLEARGILLKDNPDGTTTWSVR
jgi:cysteinyl-tRNA synthetase